jgi:hypothetical protein
MLPTEARIKELRERFGVWNGQFWAVYRYKNLNWYLVKYTDLMNSTNGPAVKDVDRGEWFCFGDIREEDGDRLAKLLNPGEVLVLGWKELGPDVRKDEFFGNGGDIWMIITTGGVRYDKAKHGDAMVRRDA